MRRVILHAGTHKTGSSTLQFHLHGHRHAFAKHGLLYAAAPFDAKKKIWRSNNWMAQAFTGKYDYELTDVTAAIETVLVNAKPDDTLLISSEDLSACCAGHPLWSGIDLSAFRKLQHEYLSAVSDHLHKVISPFGPFTIETVLVFRRADEFAHSLYQTLISSNRTRRSFEEFLTYATPLFDYGKQIDAFERVFGEARLLSFSALSDGDLVDRFLNEIGVEYRTPAAVQYRNPSTDARVTYWQANRGQDADAVERRRFGQSEAARSLFPDFGAASFWHDLEERTTFHDRHVEGFPDGFFPPARHRSSVDPRLNDAELDRVSEAYRRWRHGSAKGIYKSSIAAFSSIFGGLKRNVLGKRRHGGKTGESEIGGDANYRLKSPDALRYVLETRQSESLKKLRLELAREFSGRRCIVIGSAPDAAIVSPSADDRVICVNASGWLAKRAGIASATLTVLPGRSLANDNPVRTALARAIEGLKTDWLLFVEVALSQSEAENVLNEVGMDFGRISTIDPLERAAILGESWREEIALGPGTKTDDKPSTGIFGASVAIWAGASEIVLCGFSLQGGHAYINGETPRAHVKGDRQFFSLASRLDCRISTTSETLSREFGIPFAQGDALPSDREIEP